MELFSLHFLLFFFLVFLSLYLYFFSASKTHNNNGFKIYPGLGALPEFLRNRHRFHDWTTAVLAGCPTNSAYIRRPGNAQGILTANPQNVEHMLKSNFENYPKGPRFISILEDFLGRGIFNSDGELWKVQRKTASYEFNTKSLRNFVMENVGLEIQNRLLPVLSKASQTKRVVDLQNILERFAFDNVCKLAFNVDPGCLGEDGTKGAKFMEAFEDASNIISQRFLYAVPKFWKVTKFFDIGSERRLRESIRIVHEYADEIIRSRMQAKDTDPDQDLLSRFIGNEGNNSPEFLRDIVISFILAGRDTTSAALSWFLWILSSRPDIQKNILDELRLVRAKRLNNSDKVEYSFEELRDMHYLHAALSETMRLYPPVAVDTKECLNDDVLPDGTVVKKGWFLAYHTYAMGRMESIWGKDCNEYKPERWLENGVYKPESPFRFPVFHAGLRMCLGKDLAYIQMKSVAARIIQRFDIEVEEKGKRAEYLMSLTLRMKGGLRVKVKERDNADASG
uniref:Cytochrome P450 oxidase CYP94D72 n=1 Tax=Polygala tenuifolia TaxID=355332 RepID=A0A3G5ANN7_9FABA|nr:cytochrome P450 oxidase CYP94D72 [Polygala tenuifolia]